MLIHSTFKNDLQERYRFLVDKYIRQMRAEDDLPNSYFGQLIQAERKRLYELGIGTVESETFWNAMNLTLRETTIWLVNSASDVKKIKWNSAPFHILLGGNKLDRGFTVEGLTVTYMNRPPTAQVDTLEQRARAFGYRSSLLPYCQFFATVRTVKMLVGIVHTEDDLRTSLRDSLELGKSVKQWSKEIGLILPSGSKASRANVLPALSSYSPDGEWQSLRRPSLDPKHKESNLHLLKNLGMFEAEKRNFGRVIMRHKSVSRPAVIDLLEKWLIDPASPGWRHDEILDFLRRQRTNENPVAVFLMTSQVDESKPRVRKWADDTGFVNLFQGRDVTGSDYLGDREFAQGLFPEDSILLQVHHVSRRDYDDKDLYTLAIRFGGHTIVRKIGGK
jgi:hypothetical protein